MSAPASITHSHRARVAIAVLLALGLTLATWGRSYLRLAAVEYRFGSTIEPGGANGEAQWWTFRARRLLASHWRGKLTFGLGEYRSLAPTREELSAWDNYGGWAWTWMGLPPDYPVREPSIYWRSPLDFMFVGLGTQREGNMTQGTRIVCVPHWAAAIALAGAAFALWRPGRRRAARLARGECPACGYTLTGVAPGTPCPKCGAAPAQNAD